MIRRILYWALAALMLVSCAKDRSQILKVYNWSSYIDESVIPEFEEWYEEQTGEKIEVIYQTFDVNETMLSKIEKGHEDYDVVCPSDYIIERMLNNDLLLPLSFDELPEGMNYIDQSRSPFIEDVFWSINPEINANEYSVAYMWGTTGILYNAKYVTDEEASTLAILTNPKFADKIFIKDAPRDVYGPVLIHLRQDELKSGKISLAELMEDSSDESIADVEDYMKKARDLVAGWEADFGKEQMTQERGYINFTRSGDAVWAIEEAAEVGVELRYVVPTEGSTVWFDGWVIPKYAVNVKAATYFIDFMCRPDIAIRNMEETGYVSANGDISVMESQIDDSYDPVDLSYFFGEDATEICINPALYPDKSVMDLCVLEHDWGEKTEKLIAMWSRVKGNDANASTIIIISVFLLGMLALGLYNKFFSKKAKRRRAARRRARNK